MSLDIAPAEPELTVSTLTKVVLVSIFEHFSVQIKSIDSFLYSAPPGAE